MNTVMNGWFLHQTTNWPPSPMINPVFVSFHLTDWNDTTRRVLNPKGVGYLKNYEPIGCRDQHTADLLKSHGIEAYNSKCLTLTFERRHSAPKLGVTALVDVESDMPIPGSILKNSIRMTHKIEKVYSETTKMQLARELLEFYRTKVSRVITTRLHCALPCVAMGIPVVFFWKRR